MRRSLTDWTSESRLLRVEASGNGLGAFVELDSEAFRGELELGFGEMAVSLSIPLSLFT